MTHSSLTLWNMNPYLLAVDIFQSTITSVRLIPFPSLNGLNTFPRRKRLPEADGETTECTESRRILSWDRTRQHQDLCIAHRQIKNIVQRTICVLYNSLGRWQWKFISERKLDMFWFFLRLHVRHISSSLDREFLSCSFVPIMRFCYIFAHWWCSVCEKQSIEMRRN